MAPEEIGAGDLEGRTDEEAHLLYLETAFSWAAGDRDRAMPGGPDGHAFFRGYDRAVARLVALGATSALVVSHGAAIRVWAAGSACDLDVDRAADHPLANTGRVVLEGSLDTGWEVLEWTSSPAGGIGTAEPEPDEEPTGAGMDEAKAEVAGGP